MENLISTEAIQPPEKSPLSLIQCFDVGITLINCECLSVMLLTSCLKRQKKKKILPCI